MWQPNSNERGSFLLEVLAAMALLAMALLAVVPMFLLASRENAAASDLTFATTSAYDRAETLKRVAYTALAGGQDTVQLRLIKFSRVWTIDNDVPYPGMKRVTVTVTPARRSPHGENRVAVVRFHRVP
jgi:type II secretory pathway pseudopilin PulG